MFGFVLLDRSPCPKQAEDSKWSGSPKANFGKLIRGGWISGFVTQLSIAEDHPGSQLSEKFALFRTCYF